MSVIYFVKLSQTEYIFKTVGNVYLAGYDPCGLVLHQHNYIRVNCMVCLNLLSSHNLYFVAMVAQLRPLHCLNRLISMNEVCGCRSLIFSAQVTRDERIKGEATLVNQLLMVGEDNTAPCCNVSNNDGEIDEENVDNSQDSENYHWAELAIRSIVAVFLC